MTSSARMVPWLVSIVLGLCSQAVAVEPARIVRPLRQLELVTGEQLLVEFLWLDEDACEFRWHGHTRCRLPLAAIRSVSNPAGAIDHWDESFEDLPPESTALSGRGAWHSQRDSTWQRSVETPITVGELTLWRRMIDPGAGSPAATLRCQFRESENTGKLVVIIRGDGSVSCETPASWRKTFTQSLRTSPDWTRITVRWNANRCEVTLGDAVHTVFETDNVAFTGVAIEPSRDKTTASAAVDDLLLRECNADSAVRSMPVRAVEDQDAVTLTTGDQLFGQFMDASPAESIKLHSPQGDWSGNGVDIIRLDFARRPLPAHFYWPVQGWCFDFRSAPQDAVQGMTENLRGVRLLGKTIAHPWLGEMAWSPSPRIIIVPYGWGEFRWLEPDRHHLGDEIRSDLSVALPVGTSLTGQVQLDQRRQGNAWMVLDVAELEPSGPETLPTQPFLKTLRGGGLRTELVINDHIITDLNRLISIQTAAQNPQRVWVPIPRSVWQDGPNDWKLRQQPLSPTQLQYDDCEVGRVALWIPSWPW